MKKTFLLLTLILVFTLTVPAFAGNKPGGGGGGGGGHTEPTGNNLSYPVVWGEGAALALPGTMLTATLTVPYFDYPIDCGAGVMAYAYAQKTLGNVWQAENKPAGGSFIVEEIDWGDSLESNDMKVGRPIRVELSLYDLLDNPMVAYNMVMLANPSSPDEVQGACATVLNDGTSALTYLSPYATVYSPFGKIVIQPLVGTREDVLPGDLLWNGIQWVDGSDTDPSDVGAPIPVSFAGELNVGGKVIYGLSQGGWAPKQTGDYRITFYLPLGNNTNFDATTQVRVSAETEILAVESEGSGGGTAVVDWVNNLTYIDIRVVSGGKRP